MNPSTSVRYMKDRSNNTAQLFRNFNVMSKKVMALKLKFDSSKAKLKKQMMS